MKNKFYIYSILFATVILSSCEKNLQEQLSAVKDLHVPPGFSWETSRNVDFTVEVSDTRFNDAIHVISIYKGDPSFGGTLLSTGSASIDSPFESKIYLADTVSKVFIVKTAPDNSSTTEEVAVQSAPVKLAIGQISRTLSGSKVPNLKKRANVTIPSSPDCNTGCSETINLTQNNMDIEVRDGRTICIIGSNKIFDVTFKNGGGTLKICGNNLNLQNIKDNSNKSGIKIIVTKGSTVQFSALTMNNTQDIFENYGTVTLNSSIEPQGSVLNYGTMTVNGVYELNSTSHTEYGSLTVGQNLIINSNSSLTSFGKVTVNNDLSVNGAATLTNKCNLWVKRNLIINSKTDNHGFIKVENQTTINSAELALNNGSMIKTGNVTLYGTMKGIGTASFVKVSSKTITTGLVTGPIQFCDENGIENNWGRFTNNATLGCNLYIPVSDCNPEGNGKSPDDADSDGVTDALDAYPNDAKRAFNNYYPSASADAGATVVFEDNWPRKGDYDMNDLAISYKYKIVTDAKNKVVDIIGDYSLYATGGTFENAFGIEFPVSRSSVKSINGANLEEGQTNAVAVLFYNMRNEMTEWNTDTQKPVSAAKNYTVNINLENGPTLSAFGLGVYNPFIWNKGRGRGLEIHLPGKTPTDLADKSKFKTEDDNSSIAEGRYYVSSAGLPWALHVPVKTFEYPIEKTEIADAYLKFGAWVQSGGTSFIDWYFNKAQGYRNAGKIFSK